MHYLVVQRCSPLMKGMPTKMILEICMTMMLKAQSLMRAQICTLTQSLQQRKY